MTAPLPSATIRTSPEDFVVDELPAYEASGHGEHLFVTFRKRGLTTMDAVRMLARALDVDPRAAGYAGMKDRHAVTTQTASFQIPMARDAAAAVAQVAVPGIEILTAARHDNKLKPGHLVGNRFTITLRDLGEADAAAAGAELERAGREGVPNTFGPQRFGRDGDNPARALAWLAGRERGPRDKREQRLLFSALQSLLFNRVLERRIEDGTWSRVLAGDIARKQDTGGIFPVPLEGADLDDAIARSASGLIFATGPMFGAKMRWPEGVPGAIEREVLASSELGDPGKLEAFRHLGEGTRRALRMEVDEMSVASLHAEPAAGSMEPAPPARGSVGLVVRFVLPKGGYATTVLGRAFNLVDAAAQRRGPEAVTSPSDGHEPASEERQEQEDSA